MNTIPDKFNNDVLQANTRLKEDRLDLPIEDFIVDLYGLSIGNAKILVDGKKLTAQQTWAYVAASLSTAGAPRPFWFIVNECDEKDKLLIFIKKAKDIGNAYLQKRYKLFEDNLNAIINEDTIDIGKYNKLSLKTEEYKYGKGIKEYYEKITTYDDIKKAISPEFLRKNQLSENVKANIGLYLQGKQRIGKTLENILNMDQLSEADKKVARILFKGCYKYEDRNGQIAVMRTKHLKAYTSEVRKMMFYTDSICFGPPIFGIDRELFV